ncbi:MAG TPA: HAMP domain-containing sensor histidine kinase [Candidatus Dormibacteraeota bacterium]|jgi:signal transduction histidine kinase|nr:HAMP domain-containing sensor histidine kinase [Candidatus Dormibacteraeota bacterium]
MTPTTRKIMWLVLAWAAFLGVYIGISLTHKNDRELLSTFGNIVQCLVPLLANAGLLLNAGTPHWRRNVFWMLLALSCTLWMTGEFTWTYYEVYLHKPLPNPFSGDIVFFLRGIPVMAALALRPHLKTGELRMRLGYLDFALLFTWWTYLYVFVVTPWFYASPSAAQYNFNFNVVTNVQNMVIVIGLAALWLRASGAWRTVYANLFVATAIYLLSSVTIDVASDAGEYYTGSLLDIPLITSFFWYGLTGWIAYQRRQGLDAPTETSFDSSSDSGQGESVWATRMAMAAVLSLPLFAIYTLRFGHEGMEVRDFRLMTTLVASVPLALLVFLRTHLADADRVRLLQKSEHSVENLQRLQAQIVQSEKLVSLGQLAAGAAHEINNPLTAILGFSDLLADDDTLPEKARNTAGKIREQARRTKTLVGNLLSFARQVPSERTLLDINTVVTNAVQLRGLDLRSSKSRIELQLESVLPGVRGDGNQLMQVFFNIISNAIDAMESNNGGILTVKTIRDRGNVVILFSDTGPGLKEPHRVFDPFYTTKPVGKGTGLGLSICFGIVQEHAGKIFCYNRPEGGGAVFRVELPAVLAALPTKEIPVVVTTGSAPKTN